MVTNLVKFVRNDDSQTKSKPKWSVAKKRRKGPYKGTKPEQLERAIAVDTTQARWF